MGLLQRNKSCVVANDPPSPGLLPRCHESKRTRDIVLFQLKVFYQMCEVTLPKALMPKIT